MSDGKKEIADYRDSHKQAGGSYDEGIASSPFDAYMDRWESHYLSEFTGRFFPSRIPRYLDFACGTGRITQRMEGRADESVAVDVSESMLASAAAKCNRTRFVHADLTRDDPQIGMFDLVTAFRFFGNAQEDLREAALGAISRHLRSGGYLVFNNHRNPNSFLELAGLRSPTPQPRGPSFGAMKALLRRHGFEIVAAKAIGCWLFRHKLTTASLLESPLATRMESVFSASVFAPVAPDAILAARKA